MITAVRWLTLLPLALVVSYAFALVATVTVFPLPAALGSPMVNCLFGFLFVRLGAGWAPSHRLITAVVFTTCGITVWALNVAGFVFLTEGRVAPPLVPLLAKVLGAIVAAVAVGSQERSNPAQAHLAADGLLLSAIWFGAAGLAYGGAAYLARSGDPEMGPAFDGLGRQLHETPRLVRWIFGQESTWPGPIWFVADIVIFWTLVFGVFFLKEKAESIRGSSFRSEA